MKVKWRIWLALKWGRDWLEAKMRKSWMLGGNCDSKCINCKRWESHGAVIDSLACGDGSVMRTCRTCGASWAAVFTPAGFIPVGDFKPNGSAKPQSEGGGV